MWSKSKTLAELSLRSKLVLSGLLPSVLVLLIGGAGFVAYDLVALRASILRDLRSQAHYIAFTTRASIQFQSYEYASQILAGLETNPQVTAAAIFSPEGQALVEYFPQGRGGPLPSPREGRFPSAPRQSIWVTQPMVLDGQPIGTVFIEAGMQPFWDRLLVLLAGAIAALLLLFWLAYILSTRLQRHISAPLQALAGTARAIAERKDYAVRVPDQPGPEFRLLTQAFNQMLQTIQIQDAELRSRAEQLEAANAELESFSYSVAHDLRAPLRSLSGFSHIISARHSESLPPEAQDYLARIRSNAERMAGLIDDLLSLSHLEREPMTIVEVNPEEIAKAALEDLEPLRAGRNIELEFGQLPAARADAALLRQVYVNLLSNALKYSRLRSPACVQVGAIQNNGSAVYFVRDNGVGFDMRYAPKLFRVFQRLHSSDQFEGTGVGLAIVQRIVNRHGGRIWAESEPDKGATFYFTLQNGLN